MCVCVSGARRGPGMKIFTRLPFPAGELALRTASLGVIVMPATSNRHARRIVAGAVCCLACTATVGWAIARGATSSPVAVGCDDTCTAYARDDSCDDGGLGASWADCRFGTDCADCGARGGGGADDPAGGWVDSLFGWAQEKAMGSAQEKLDEAGEALWQWFMRLLLRALKLGSTTFGAITGGAATSARAAEWTFYLRCCQQWPIDLNDVKPDSFDGWLAWYVQTVLWLFNQLGLWATKGRHDDKSDGSRCCGCWPGGGAPPFKYGGSAKGALLNLAYKIEVDKKGYDEKGKPKSDVAKLIKRALKSQGAGWFAPHRHTQKKPKKGRPTAPPAEPLPKPPPPPSPPSERPPMPGAPPTDTGFLCISRIRAEGLRSADLLNLTAPGEGFRGKSDPYVVARCHEQSRRTHYVKQSLTPTWGAAELVLMGSKTHFREHGLQLLLYDRDFLTPDDHLGGVEVTLEWLGTDTLARAAIGHHETLYGRGMIAVQN